MGVFPSKRGVQGMVHRERRDEWAESGHDDEHYDPSPGPPGWSQPQGQGGGAYGPSPGGQPYAQPPYVHDPSYRFAPPHSAYGSYPPPYAYPYPYGPYGYPYKQPPNPQLPVVGGILIVLGNIFNALIFLTFAEPLWWAFEGTIVCFAFYVICLVIGIMGGICAMMRRFLALAIVGAVLTMVCGLFLFVGFILALVGLVLILVAHQTFAPIQEPLPRMF